MGVKVVWAQTGGNFTPSGATFNPKAAFRKRRTVPILHVIVVHVTARLHPLCITETYQAKI